MPWLRVNTPDVEVINLDNVLRITMEQVQQSPALWEVRIYLVGGGMVIPMSAASSSQTDAQALFETYANLVGFAVPQAP